MIFDTEEGYRKAYETIKKRLFEFFETGVEKQLRVQEGWSAFTKTRNMNAIQFEAAWERVHAHMVEVGFHVAESEKLIASTQKVGAKKLVKREN